MAQKTNYPSTHFVGNLGWKGELGNEGQRNQYIRFAVFVDCGKDKDGNPVSQKWNLVAFRGTAGLIASLPIGKPQLFEISIEGADAYQDKQGETKVNLKGLLNRLTVLNWPPREEDGIDNDEVDDAFPPDEDEFPF